MTGMQIDATRGAVTGAADASWRRRIRSGGPSRSTLAYSALVVFSVLYYTRPEDFIPGLAVVPINKIAGGIALAALVFGIPAVQRHRLTTELKVLLALLVQLLLCIPFAHWRGGAFDAVVNRFSKGVMVALLIYGVTNTVNELRKLLFIQAGTVALITLASLIVYPHEPPLQLVIHD